MSYVHVSQITAWSHPLSLLVKFCHHWQPFLTKKFSVERFRFLMDHDSCSSRYSEVCWGIFFYKINHSWLVKHRIRHKTTVLPIIKKIKLNFRTTSCQLNVLQLANDCENQPEDEAHDGNVGDGGERADEGVHNDLHPCKIGFLICVQFQGFYGNA